MNICKIYMVYKRCLVIIFLYLFVLTIFLLNESKEFELLSKVTQEDISQIDVIFFIILAEYWTSLSGLRVHYKFPETSFLALILCHNVLVNIKQQALWSVFQGRYSKGSPDRLHLLMFVVGISLIWSLSSCQHDATECKILKSHPVAHE